MFAPLGGIDKGLNLELSDEWGRLQRAFWSQFFFSPDVDTSGFVVSAPNFRVGAYGVNPGCLATGNLPGN